MAKKEPLFEADLGKNGGLTQFWSSDEVERFIAVEKSFWASIAEGGSDQPLGMVMSRVANLAEGLREAVRNEDRTAGSNWLTEVYGDGPRQIPLSSSTAAQGILSVHDRLGLQGTIGALSMALPVGFWSEGINSGPRPYWRGIVEQVLHETGLTPQALESATHTIRGIEGRVSDILVSARREVGRQAEANAEIFGATLEEQAKRNDELEKQRLAALTTFNERASELVDHFESINKAYREQMALRAPVEYWRKRPMNTRGMRTRLRRLFGFSLFR